VGKYVFDALILCDVKYVWIMFRVGGVFVVTTPRKCLLFLRRGIMKKKMKLMLVAVAMAVIVGAIRNPVSAATLTLTGDPCEVSFNKSEFNISVYPGKASYYAYYEDATLVYKTVTGDFGNGTVLGYRFFNSDGTVLSSYADDGSGIVAPVVSPDAADLDGSESWANVWTTTDPGVDFANPADYTADTLARGRNITGTIDISDLSSGTVYVICGGIKETVTLTVTMSGAGQTDIQAEYSIVLPSGTGPLAKNYFWVVPFDFSDAGGYDTITYHYTITLARRGRFVGVILYGVIGATNPSPANGATIPVNPNLDLSWTNMDPNVGDITYVDVWFGTEPNVTDPGYDMTKVVTEGVNTTTWTVSAPTEGTYYWQVNSYIYGPDHINEPNMIEGSLWSFNAVADLAPTVVIDTPAQMTWSGEPVPLDATVDDDGVSALTIAWTAAGGGAGITVGFAPNAAVEDPAVTITKVPYSAASIVNAGFEEPARPTDGDWGAVDNWTAIGGTNGSDIGNWNLDTEYGGTAPEGENVGWADAEAGEEIGLAQVLTETFTADTTYELTVEVGHNNSYGMSGYKVQLLAGGTVIAEDPNSMTIDPDTFKTSTVQYAYDAGDAALVDQPLEIRLFALDAGEVDFDDVQLTAVPPFPAPTGIQTVTLTVAVSDASNPEPDTDTIEIDVYDDACQMARMGLGLSAITDFDENCITDLRDFAVLAEAWLDDYAAIEAVDR
jgi:hypothetical protein